jgi:hypothetical protein
VQALNDISDTARAARGGKDRMELAYKERS